MHFALEVHGAKLLVTEGHHNRVLLEARTGRADVQIVMATFPRTSPASRCRIASATRSSG